MIHYVYEDLWAKLRFLPIGLAVGILAFLFFGALSRQRIRAGKEGLRVTAITVFAASAALILFLTLLSRESGSRQIRIDLELFSSIGINARNDAYAVENVLLFIPFGFSCAWAFLPCRSLWVNLMVGIASSLMIESLQLITGRGYFQVDDVWTNTLGAILGWLLFRIISRIVRALRRKL